MLITRQIIIKRPTLLVPAFERYVLSMCEYFEFLCFLFDILISIYLLSSSKIFNNVLKINYCLEINISIIKKLHSECCGCE